MNRAGRSDYLESKILTASGPQLHLMLVEGAIRFVRQADQQYADNNEGNATSFLLRAMEIVEELIAGVRHDDHDINAKLAQLYSFLYRNLTSVYVNADREKLADVTRILEFQRDTWRLACEHIAKDSTDGTTNTRSAPVKPVIVPAPHAGIATLSQSLSIEA